MRSQGVGCPPLLRQLRIALRAAVDAGDAANSASSGPWREPQISPMLDGVQALLARCVLVCYRCACCVLGLYFARTRRNYDSVLSCIAHSVCSARAICDYGGGSPPLVATAIRAVEALMPLGAGAGSVDEALAASIGGRVPAATALSLPALADVCARSAGREADDSAAFFLSLALRLSERQRILVPAAVMGASVLAAASSAAAAELPRIAAPQPAIAFLIDPCCGEVNSGAPLLALALAGGGEDGADRSSTGANATWRWGVCAAPASASSFGGAPDVFYSDGRAVGRSLPPLLTMTATSMSGGTSAAAAAGAAPAARPVTVATLMLALSRFSVRRQRCTLHCGGTRSP